MTSIFEVGEMKKTNWFCFISAKVKIILINFDSSIIIKIDNDTQTMCNVRINK